MASIKQLWKEDDSVYRLDGMHSVREKIEIDDYEVEISGVIKMRCNDMDEELNTAMLLRLDTPLKLSKLRVG